MSKNDPCLVRYYVKHSLWIKLQLRQTDLINEYLSIAKPKSSRLLYRLDLLIYVESEGNYAPLFSV